MALRDLAVRGPKPPQVIPSRATRKLEVGYAIVSSRGKLHTSCEMLPIWWRRNAAEEARLNQGLKTKRVVRVNIALD